MTNVRGRGAGISAVVAALGLAGLAAGEAGRLSASIPARARPGERLHLVLRDRTGRGELAFRLCVTPPGGRRHCARQRESGVRVTFAGPRLSRPGDWVVHVGDLRRRVARRSVRVWPRHGRVRLLAAGDSEMQDLDDLIAARLRGRGFRTISDTHVSTGLTNTFFFDWYRHAGRVAAARRPEVTVMFVGANDGFPLRDRRGHSVNCCTRRWSVLLAHRAGRVMDRLLRGAAGRVYWFTLPVPRSRAQRAPFRAIDLGYRLAAARRPERVRLIDAERFFTPHGYRDRMTWRGRDLTIHAEDGYHLSYAADELAADLFVRALRADRVLRPARRASAPARGG